MELARQWGLADAAYFYTTSAADAQLEASTLTDGYLDAHDQQRRRRARARRQASRPLGRDCAISSNA
jgi:hypothetical protein